MTNYFITSCLKPVCKTNSTYTTKILLSDIQDWMQSVHAKVLSTRRATTAVLTKCVRVWFQQVDISRDGCGESKLCVAEPENCDPAENNMCFLATFDTDSRPPNGTALVTELSGYSMDFVALGLKPNSSQVKPTSHASAFKMHSSASTGCLRKAGNRSSLLQRNQKLHLLLKKRGKSVQIIQRHKSAMLFITPLVCQTFLYTSSPQANTKLFDCEANSLVWELLGFIAQV